MIFHAIGLPASTLPSNDGYVAAAYIVFFVLLLVYLAIMGLRLTRMERKLKDIEGAKTDGRTGEAEAGERPGAAGEREQELV